MADVTVTHPLAPSLGLSLDAAKKAVERKAQRKNQKYSALVAAHRMEFTPVAMSTFGELGEEAEKVLDEAACFFTRAPSRSRAASA